MRWVYRHLPLRLRRFIDRWRSWHLRRDIEAGRLLRGRQPAKGDGGAIEAKTEPKASISARVYRASTDSWEELGQISRPKEE